MHGASPNSIVANFELTLGRYGDKTMKNRVKCRAPLSLIPTFNNTSSDARKTLQNMTATKGSSSMLWLDNHENEINFFCKNFDLAKLSSLCYLTTMNLKAKSDLFTLLFESHYLPKFKILSNFYYNVATWQF